MKLLLFPFTLIYQLVLSIRHLLFNLGILHSESFEIPVISVGNLSMGGTGKTPHIEYLVRLLKKNYRVAILSRGYGRKTKGFVLGNDQMTSMEIGDEPKQYLQKFSDITVAVDEKRRNGIRKLLNSPNSPHLILLDDAFQHRYVKPGLNILLTDYHNLYTKDYIVPAGNLRDNISAAKRADIIVVTKTPAIFSPFIERDLYASIKPTPDQKLFFSYIQYGNLTSVVKSNKIYVPRSIGTILLLTGIANPYPLKEYLNDKCNDIMHMDFPDHHPYTEKDFQKIASNFDSIIGKNKMIVTTEKDAMRLTDSPYFRTLENLPLFFVPIEIRFHDRGGSSFDEMLLEYVRKNHENYRLYSGKS
ncbi:MAG: tetraacyldisaccharide 4'-kinase [Bacteroidetes bacterium HGW-Bacteroidetes-1]|jgi:tetraacyldisaccharide 4'-kinase|nr:MAG: tetraacyldisaccharide 4'-kinase [Bacteroidetes bacterium HGW-Bacteroidetes-1]